MAWTKEEINEIYGRVMQKASIDKEFRSELLENPKSAIEKLTGVEVPAGTHLKVIESDENYDATFVLPDLTTGELNLDDLEEVAGGVAIVFPGACAADFGPNILACAAHAGK